MALTAARWPRATSWSRVSINSGVVSINSVASINYRRVSKSCSIPSMRTVLTNRPPKASSQTVLPTRPNNTPRRQNQRIVWDIRQEFMLTDICSPLKKYAHHICSPICSPKRTPGSLVGVGPVGPNLGPSVTPRYPSETTLGPLWDTSVPLWGFSGPIWDPSGAILGPLCDTSGTHL